MNRIFSKILLASLLTFSVGVFAQRDVNPIPVAAPVLTIAPDARAGGMGDAGVATAPDVILSIGILQNTRSVCVVQVCLCHTLHG